MKIKAIKKHWKILDKNKRITILYGGTRSGKTFTILQYIAVNAILGKFKLASVVSKTFSHLRKGALREFRSIVQPLGELIKENKSLMTFTFPSGAVVEFFSADTEAKLRGPQRDWLFINEVNLLSQEEFAQLYMRTSDRIFLDFNPVGKFWLDDFIENLNPDDYVIDKSTHWDNPFLSKAQREAIENMRFIDEVLYKIYALGEREDYRGRAVLNWDIATEGQYDHIAARTRPYIGIDFGFSYAETAVVAAWQVGQYELYVKELLYKQGQCIDDIKNVLQSIDYEVALADAAQPDMIKALQALGLDYIAPCKKIELRQSYAILNRYRIIIDPKSVNLIREVKNLQWKDEKHLNGYADHAIDALRYIVHYLYL
jgi:phage terminase large subunit